MAWITSPLKAGPLPSNSFTWTITGLTAGSTYRYRLYFIVDGTEYYGNTLTGTTGAPAMLAPSMLTGTAGSITPSGYNVTGNEVTDKGGVLPVQEYGILYTQYAFFGTDSTLIYSNIGANVSKASTLADIATGITYNNSASGLPASTTTWYRAFAKNATGVGYGAVKTAITAAIPVTQVCAYLSRSYGNTASGPDQDTGGYIHISGMTTVGQFVTVNYNICHVLFGNNISTDNSQAQTFLYKRCGIGGSYVQIPSTSCYISFSPSNSPPAAASPPDRVMAHYQGSVVLSYGDDMCYLNHLPSDGVNGGTYGTTCVDLWLMPMGTSSVDVSSSVNLNHCEDCTYIL